MEVLSRSNRENDLDLKMVGYPRGGLPYYWVVDLDVPSIVADALRGDAFVEVARCSGGRPASLPFQGGELTVAASDLVHRP